MRCAFQRAPTLGGECYIEETRIAAAAISSGFNGHPPLGVNATHKLESATVELTWLVSTGTHPWG